MSNANNWTLPWPSDYDFNDAVFSRTLYFFAREEMLNMILK